MLGNTLYGLSVLLKNPEVGQSEGSYLLHHLPWLVGSLGVLLLDTIVSFRAARQIQRPLPAHASIHPSIRPSIHPSIQSQTSCLPCIPPGTGCSSEQERGDFVSERLQLSGEAGRTHIIINNFFTAAVPSATEKNRKSV